MNERKKKVLALDSILNGGEFSFGSNYIVYNDDFPNLTGWTISGDVTATGGVVTFADVGAGALSMHKNITLPTDAPFLIEIVYTCATTNKFAFWLRTTNGAVTPVQCTINNSAGVITLATTGQGATNYTQTNWTQTERNKMIIWADPVNAVARFYHYYKDSSNGAERMEEVGAAKSWTWTAANVLANVYFGSGSTNTGNITIETLKIYKNWATIIGDSIATGHNGYSPIPAFYSPNTYPYSIDSYMNADRGDLVRVLNQGIGGHVVADLLARYSAMIVRTLPKYAIIEIGSNDAFVGTTIATAQANLGTIVDGINAAGIKCVLVEIPPRNNFDATMNTWKDTWNAWLPGFATSKNAIMITCHDLLEDPANSNKLLPAYTTDNIHPNAAGYRAMATKMKINSIT